MFIYFRADGNSQIGLGHITRSLALAQMLQARFDIRFLIQAPIPAIINELKTLGIECIILPQTADFIAEANYLAADFFSFQDILVLDGYQFTTSYQRTIKEKGTKLVCIDDIHAFHFFADGIINPAGGVSATVYSAEPYTKIITGPGYSLLRKPFLEAAGQTTVNLNLQKLFINLGGADIENFTLQVLKGIQSLPRHFKEIHVVIGAANPHGTTLKKYIQAFPIIYLHQNLDAVAMCQLMQDCRVGICPPSGVSYEFCVTRGLLFLLQTAPNQAAMQAYLLKEGLALPYSDFPDLTANHRRMVEKTQEFSDKQATIFDGKAAERFIHFFSNL